MSQSRGVMELLQVTHRLSEMTFASTGKDPLKKSICVICQVDSETQYGYLDAFEINGQIVLVLCDVDSGGNYAGLPDENESDIRIVGFIVDSPVEDGRYDFLEKNDPMRKLAEEKFLERHPFFAN